MKSQSTERPGLPRCYVVGTGFEGRQKIIRKHCFETMDVQLLREPNNPHDPDAVSVWVEVPGFLRAKRKQIGYLKRGHAERIAKVLGDNYRLWAQIDEIYNPEGRDHPVVRLNVGYD